MADSADTQGEGRQAASGATTPRRATAVNLEAVVELIVEQQAKVDRNVPSLGDTRLGIKAELDDLKPPWTETLRIVDGNDRNVIGAVLVEWDTEAHWAWIHGPWIQADDDRWAEIGDVLLGAATSQLPSSIKNTVITATVEHHHMAALADQNGWAASEVNHVLIADATTIEAWPIPNHPAPPRPMTHLDVPTIRTLHDIEFPDTYFSAAELAARATRGDQTVLIVDGDDGTLLGYIAGQIQPDGDGYIDYLAVAPSARRDGVGRRLIVEMCQQLASRSTTRRVCLTVQTGRIPARRLYDSLGFKTEVSILGFDSPTEPH